MEILVGECSLYSNYLVRSSVSFDGNGVPSGVRRKFSWGGVGSGTYGGHLYLVCCL